MGEVIVAVALAAALGAITAIGMTALERYCIAARAVSGLKIATSSALVLCTAGMALAIFGPYSSESSEALFTFCIVQFGVLAHFLRKLIGNVAEMELKRMIAHDL